MSSVADVVNGKVDISESSQETERKTGSALGKEDFLMLLVTQMQYQDPLSPMENTEYVSQLAQFTELEEMENLNSTTTNTSAFSLVGQEVYIQETSATGNTTDIQGTVEYVTIQNGKAYVSVNGELYSYDSIVQVIDPYYLLSQYAPQVEEQKVTYQHHDPQDVVINGVSLGSNGYEAASFAVAVIKPDGTTEAIDKEYLTYKDGVLTIDKEAFSKLDAGNYRIAFVFDDPNESVNYSSVSLEVKGIRDTTGDEEEGDGDTDVDEGTGDAGDVGDAGDTDGSDGTGDESKDDTVV